MPQDLGSTRPLIDKLGVKPESRVAVWHIADRNFLDVLHHRAVHITINKTGSENDIVFVGIESQKDLMRIAKQIPHIRQNGAIWAVYPKGVKIVTESDIRGAGLAAGLVDNKVVSFSLTLTALRFVIRRADRR